MQDTILSITQAAKFLGVCNSTLHNWEADGTLIPYKKTKSNRRYYTISQLEEFADNDVRVQANKNRKKFKESSNNIKSIMSINDLKNIVLDDTTINKSKQNILYYMLDTPNISYNEVESYMNSKYTDYDIITDITSNSITSGLSKLIDMIINHEINHLCLLRQYDDRAIAIIKYLATKFNCEVVYIEL